MSELPKNSIDQTERGSIAQRIARVLALCAALGGGCATNGNQPSVRVARVAPMVTLTDRHTTVAQDTEAKAPENEPNCKPAMPVAEEWAKGPEIFEKDGRIFAVGKVDCGDSGKDNLAYFRDKARANARANLRKYLSGLSGNYSFYLIPGPITEDYGIPKGCPNLLYALDSATKDTNEPESNETENERPEWVDGPKTFEKDGYLYAVGAHDFSSKEDESIKRRWAEMDATKTIATILFGQERVNNGDGTESLYTKGTISGMRYLEYHTEYNNDGTGTQYVLARVNK